MQGLLAMKEINKPIKYTKRLLQAFYIYLSIAGLLSFSLFILEESFQTVMFSTWQAKDTQSIDLLVKAYKYQDKIYKSLKLWAKIAFYINPLAGYVYDIYADSADIYNKALLDYILQINPKKLLNLNLNIQKCMIINEIQSISEQSNHIILNLPENYQFPMKITKFGSLYIYLPDDLTLNDQVCFTLN
jgi:hypothetical protein